MHPSAKMPLLVSVIFAVSFGDCCHPDSFVGLWQTETTHRSVPGHTNTVEAIEVVEFFKDRSFKIADVLIVDGQGWTNVSFRGTYTLIGTNQASMKITALNIPPGSAPPSLTVSCSIIGNELEIPKFTASVAAEFKRYRRAK
jgi:hypothetical protein